MSANPAVSRRTWRLWLLAAIVAILAYGVANYLYYWRPWLPVGRPMLIAETTTPSGCVVQLVQFRNEVWTEPYTVSLYAKVNDKTYWFYIDHEDVYWSSGSLTWQPNAQRVLVTRGGTPFGLFDPERLTLYRFENDRVDQGTERGPLPIGQPTTRP